MKVELTAAEQKELNNIMERNTVRQWYAQKENLKFEVGDILVKYIARYNYDTKGNLWELENITSGHKMPQRYVYIHEDEYGIGYLKHLKVSDGALGKEIFCLTDFNYKTTRFEVDPEYAERVLLDAKFDIKELHKASLESKRIATRMNRKMGVKPKALSEFNAFFEKLKVGDDFYVTSDYTGSFTRKYTLTAIAKISVQRLDKAHNWDLGRFREKFPGGVDTTETYRISYTGDYNRDGFDIFAFYSDVLYLQPPAKEEKKQ